MWTEEIPIFRVVNTHIGFQNATLLRGKAPADIWTSSVECWASVYSGYPALIRLDEESGFTSKA